jgi:RNA polymerase sigma factor (sigma-70 family)
MFSGVLLLDPVEQAGCAGGSGPGLMTLRRRTYHHARPGSPCPRNLSLPGDMYSVIMLESAQNQRFRILYQANYARILGYTLRRTASADDAADVVAETFATAWRKLDEIPAREEAALWLYGVARRVLANHYRRETGRSAVLARLAGEYKEAIWLDPIPTAGRVSPALAEAWAALGPDDRDLLGLVVWETLTTEQIASVLGCARTAAKVRIHRARRRFARELESRGLRTDGTQAADVAGPGEGGKPSRGAALKPSALTRHVQAGRADALPDTEAT